MTVIFPGMILKCRRQCLHGLIYGRIPDGMELDLQTRSVCPFGELDHLFVGIEENSSVVRIVGVGLVQGCVAASETAVQRGGEATTDTGQTPSQYLVHIHGLEE